MAASFDRDARTALADGQLRGALRQATDLFAERRRAALATVPDWEGARDRARAIKDETLLHLDRYLEQFTTNAERAGARVHWARDAAEACEIIGRIAEQRGARSVVKSKSMASEEIHLNERLARRGIEPVETDLGEYIVQLAGETPSHIVVPAIHKTKAQIAALFAEKLGIELSDDVATLAAAARQALRRGPQRGSGVPADRRPCVRVGLSRSDRRDRDPAAVRPRAIERAPLRLEPVRRLPGRVSRQDRHPGGAAPSARPGGGASGRLRGRSRAPRVLGVCGGDGAAPPVRVAGARRADPRDPATAASVDQVARPSPPRAAQFSRAVAGPAARPGGTVTPAGDAARRDILRAVRENLARGPSPPGPLSVPARGDVLRSPSPAGRGGQGVRTFTEQLAAAGAQCTIVSGEAEAAASLARILTGAGARRVVGSDAPLVQRLLGTLGAGFSVERVEQLSRDQLFACDAGVTTAQWGIAETGTLVLESARELSRRVSPLPPIHVALMSARCICISLG